MNYIKRIEERTMKYKELILYVYHEFSNIFTKLKAWGFSDL